MKYLLAIALFLAGAIFPFALSAQSFHPRLSPPGVEPFQTGGLGFRPFRGGAPRVVLPPFFGYPSNYPFEYFYPGLWPPIDYEYEQASRIAHGDVAAEVAAQEKNLLSSRVQQLTDEVRSLRQEQSARHYAAQVPPAPPSSELRPRPSPQAQPGTRHEFPATVFIYKDGQEMEARDYAILGKTLWVFHGKLAHKFPLSEFNLEASRQVNEEHGVEFPLSVPYPQ